MVLETFRQIAHRHMAVGKQLPWHSLNSWGSEQVTTQSPHVFKVKTTELSEAFPKKHDLTSHKYWDQFIVHPHSLCFLFLGTMTDWPAFALLTSHAQLAKQMNSYGLLLCRRFYYFKLLGGWTIERRKLVLFLASFGESFSQSWGSFWI